LQTAFLVDQAAMDGALQAVNWITTYVLAVLLHYGYAASSPGNTLSKTRAGPLRSGSYHLKR